MGFLAFGCETNPENTVEKAKQVQANRMKTKAMLKQLGIGEPKKEDVALLAAKYELGPDLVTKLIDEYLTENDWSYRVVKESLQGKKQLKPIDPLNENADPSRTIIKLSNKYNVPTQIVASIVIDYMVFKKLEEVETSKY